MSSFFVDGQFTDAWIVDRTLFEHLSGVGAGTHMLSITAHGVLRGSNMLSSHAKSEVILLCNDHTRMMCIRTAVYTVHDGTALTSVRDENAILLFCPILAPSARGRAPAVGLLAKREERSCRAAPISVKNSSNEGMIERFHDDLNLASCTTVEVHGTF